MNFAPFTEFDHRPTPCLLNQFNVSLFYTAAVVLEPFVTFSLREFQDQLNCSVIFQNDWNGTMAWDKHLCLPIYA